MPLKQLSDTEAAYLAGLLGRISPYLRTYKAGRARLLLEGYVRVTPRNGRYTPCQRAARQAFEERFFANSVRARVHIS